MSQAPGPPDYDRIALAIRCASAAVAIYDYLETMPTAAKFYRHQWQERRATLGISSLLFFLIRVSSIAVITISSVGYFANFTLESCRHYYLLPPTFKVIQGMVSHAILGVRAYNASSRNKALGWGLAVLYVVVITLQWISTLAGRTAEVTASFSCRGKSPTHGLFAAWIYYVVAIAFDSVVTAIAVFYLGKQLKSTRGLLSQIVRIMLRDGIGYLVLLTLANGVNASFYRSAKELQNAFAVFGYTVTWIMSQRLILHLYHASVMKRDEQLMTTTNNGLLTVTQNLTTTRSVHQAVRSQFSRKDTAFTDLTVPEFSMDLERAVTRDSIPENEEPRVTVRVEKTVRVNSRKVRYELEDYSRGGPSRNSRQF